MNITIKATDDQTIIKTNFWNHIHFHPTDAIEDIWGKRILEKVSQDQVAKYVRMYAMLEDIVTRSPGGELQYDFSMNDHRLDYLLGLGFKPLICYNFMPRAIAKNPLQLSKLERYKGKRINFSEPADYLEWQEVVYQYAKHVTERYGVEEVKQWYMHCWNEPDLHYWLSDQTYEVHEEKLHAYCRLYDHFAAGVKRVSSDIRIGGPSACYNRSFVDAFLRHTREGRNDATGEVGTPIDFFSVHVYSINPAEFSKGLRPSVKGIVENIFQEYSDIAKRHGYGDLEIIADEWGAASNGFSNVDQFPDLIFRETEYFPAFYVRMVDTLIREMPKRQIPLSKMMICLSGQHDLDRDFEGYRSFFTLNDYKKPIYNGYVLMAKLGDRLLTHQSDQIEAGVGVIPTKDDNGCYKIALYHSDDDFSKKLGNKRVSLHLEGIEGRYRIRHYRLDHTHSNAYTMYKELGSPSQPTQQQREAIQQAGELKLYYPEYTADLQGSYEEHIVLTGHAVSFLELEPLR